MALMGAFLLFIGARVIASKRPIFMPSRFFFAFMVLAFSPQFVNAVNMSTNDLPGNMGLFQYLGPLMFVCLLVYFWLQMKGYMAIGVSDDSFRDALHFSLNKNNLPFEEQLSVIKLTSINATLQIAIQSWIGAGQIKLKRSKDTKILPAIILGINQYYVENNIRPNNITSVLYVVMGIFLLVSAGAIFYLFSIILPLVRTTL